MSPDAVRSLLKLPNLSDVKAFQIADILDRRLADRQALLDVWKVQEKALADLMLKDNPPGLHMDSSAIDCIATRMPTKFSTRLPSMGQYVLVFGKIYDPFTDSRSIDETGVDGVGQFSIEELVATGAYWLPGEYTGC